MIPYLEIGDLRIAVRAGTGTTLLVVSSGVGLETHGWQPPEFNRYVAQHPEHHAMFVIDSGRSWLNAPGLIEQISEAVRTYRDAHGVRQVVTLGNSMGGFMSLALADTLEASCAIAFAPQFSVNPAVIPGETRWQPLRARITTWRVQDVASMMSGRAQQFIFQGLRQQDALHWDRMPHYPSVHHYLFQNHSHFVVRHLRDQMVLHPIIDHAIAGRPRRVRSLAEAAGGLKRNHFERLTDATAATSTN